MRVGGEAGASCQWLAASVHRRDELDAPAKMRAPTQPGRTSPAWSHRRAKSCLPRETLALPRSREVMIVRRGAGALVSSSTASSYMPFGVDRRQVAESAVVSDVCKLVNVCEHGPPLWAKAALRLTPSAARLRRRGTSPWPRTSARAAP